MSASLSSKLNTFLSSWGPFDVSIWGLPVSIACSNDFLDNKIDSTGSLALFRAMCWATPGNISPGMNALGGTIFPLTMRFMTWKKSRSLLSLKAKTAALDKSFSLSSFDRFCSSLSLPNFSSFNFSSSSAVESCQTFIFESLPPVIIISVGHSSVSLTSSAKSMAQIWSSCISKVLRQACLETFHTLTIPSTDAEVSWSPALSQHTLTSDDLCPCSVLTH